MRYIIALAFIFLFLTASAQKKDSLSTGQIEGIVWDSVHNYVLQAASVVVFAHEKGDTSMLNYTLTDRDGKFFISGLPIGANLKLLATFSGYSIFDSIFSINASAPKFIFKKIDLRVNETLLENVVVTSVVPVRMNGDTLEFNPRAFKLESNAVVEDLLRRLPGMTVWGDGSITINGREVSNVLVNGKPFFGGKPKIATQNLSTTSVDKIQVYSNVMPGNPLDSITSMNIKLKKGIKSLFGKLSFSQGTDKRKETGGVVNIFSSRTQLAIGGMRNNINKMLPNMSVLMENNTFKGTGANIDHQSNFEQQGLTKSTAGGIFFQHDFADKIDYEHNNRINANYFLNNEILDINKNTITKINFGGKGLVRTSDFFQTSNKLEHAFDASYNKLTPYKSFLIAPYLSIANKKSEFRRLENTVDESDILQNRTTSEMKSNVHSSDLGFKAEFSNKAKIQDESKFPKSYTIGLSFKNVSSNEDKSSLMKFYSETESSANRHIEREYMNDLDKNIFQLNFHYPNLNKLLSYNNLINRLDLKVALKNNIETVFENFRSSVQDYDTTNHSFLSNLYLTNTSAYKSITNNGGLSINKTFSKNLSNRYSKNVFVNVDLNAQNFYQKNQSEKSFQDIHKSYCGFLPAMILEYRNLQFGKYAKTYTLSYSSKREYPSIDQLAPLVDSINLLDLIVGNPVLRASFKHEMMLTYLSITQRKAPFLTYSLSVFGNLISNEISDSMVYDLSGKTIHYPVNVSQSQSLGFNGRLSKAYKFRKNQLQLLLNTNTVFSKKPVYVENNLISSNIFSSNNNVKINYTFKDVLAMEISQLFSFFKNDQSAINRSFSNQRYRTTFSISQNITKKLNVNANISYNTNVSTITDNINFTILNATIGYRFLKSNQGELKLSGFDLLKQNKSIINYSSPNSLTIGTSNVLRQFFMVTFSYYPRIAKK